MLHAKLHTAMHANHHAAITPSMQSLAQCNNNSRLEALHCAGHINHRMSGDSQVACCVHAIELLALATAANR
jgi:hypothetical protein